MGIPLSSHLDWEIANPLWSQSLNPFLLNPLNNVQLLKNVQLLAGENTINHGLGRLMNGWFIVDIEGIATIYRSSPLNSFTLTLTSSAEVICALGVF